MSSRKTLGPSVFLTLEKICILCDISRLEYTEGSEQCLEVLHGKHSTVSENEVTAFTGNFSLCVYVCVLISKKEIFFRCF